MRRDSYVRERFNSNINIRHTLAHSDGGPFSGKRFAEIVGTAPIAALL
jgi:hypothetical protein